VSPRPKKFRIKLEQGTRDGSVVRALASHQCSPGWTLPWWVEFVGSLLAVRDFSMDSPVFLL